jgi:hypothetical protein
MVTVRSLFRGDHFPPDKRYTTVMNANPGPESPDSTTFREALQKLREGSFTASEPYFVERADLGRRCQIVHWHELGLFANEPEALAEALACACFLGKTEVVRLLLDQGVDVAAGNGTGMNGFHWAANRGELETVKLLIERKAPHEIKNMYGGTVLGATVWSAIHEPRPNQLAVIQALLAAGANVNEAGYPTGNREIDEVLRRYGAN